VGFPPFFWRLHDARRRLGLHRFARLCCMRRGPFRKCRRLVDLVVFVASVAPRPVNDLLRPYVHFAFLLTLFDVSEAGCELCAGRRRVRHVKEQFSATFVVHERIDLLDAAYVKRLDHEASIGFRKFVRHRAASDRRRKHESERELHLCLEWGCAFLPYNSFQFFLDPLHKYRFLYPPLYFLQI